MHEMSVTSPFCPPHSNGMMTNESANLHDSIPRVSRTDNVGNPTDEYLSLANLIPYPALSDTYSPDSAPALSPYHHLDSRHSSPSSIGPPSPYSAGALMNGTYSPMKYLNMGDGRLSNCNPEVETAIANRKRYSAPTLIM
jgi:hypothetical protein